MATTPKWLKDYFGSSFSEFSPVVVLDGKKYAVVQLFSDTGSKTYSGTGYVLIKKSGRFSATPHRSLHEGVAKAEDITRMKAILEKADS